VCAAAAPAAGDHVPADPREKEGPFLDSERQRVPGTAACKKNRELEGNETLAPNRSSGGGKTALPSPLSCSRERCCGGQSSRGGGSAGIRCVPPYTRCGLNWGRTMRTDGRSGGRHVGDGTRHVPPSRAVGSVVYGWGRQLVISYVRWRWL
jgi:hypothetical protein